MNRLRVPFFTVVYNKLLFSDTVCVRQISALSHGGSEFFPRFMPIEHQRDGGGNRPAYRPCTPDTCCAKLCAGECDSQYNTDDQIRESGGNEFAHEAGSAQCSVSNELGRDDKIKRGYDAQQHKA